MAIAITQQACLVQCRDNELAAHHQNMVGPPHILAAILEAKDSAGYRLLERLANVVQLNSEIQSIIGTENVFYEQAEIHDRHSALDYAGFGHIPCREGVNARTDGSGARKSQQSRGCC